VQNRISIAKSILIKKGFNFVEVVVVAADEVHGLSARLNATISILKVRTSQLCLGYDSRCARLHPKYFSLRQTRCQLHQHF